MSPTFRPYRSEDFGRVRDLLVTSYALTPRPLNWRLERWNYARYFVVPMLATWGGPNDEMLARRAERDWEASIGVWEDGGAIVGVALCEDQRQSEAFLLRHPAHGAILDEMITYAEEHLRDPESGALRIPVYDHDGELQGALRRRGFAPQAEHPGYDALYRIATLLTPELPEGYVIRSMAEDRDIERRREVFGRAFNHPDPQDWPSAYAYEELERAPDYRPELDLYVVAPDGRYVSCCIVWWDDVNGMGAFEPVGTHPDFRRLSLGRAVVWEGIRRVATLGADRCWVGSGQRFYEAIGFQKELVSYTWRKPL